MSNLADAKGVDNPAPAVFQPRNKLRFVTAASLFDGHDASINIMRRLLQGLGAEVIHLGHNRSVDEIVTAALQEDVQGIAVSSYQGGHNEFFRYMVDQLRARGGANIKVFGGGGGVIIPAEIQGLQQHGVERIYSPEDGQKLGLQGMIADMMQRADYDITQCFAADVAELNGHSESAWRKLSQTITGIEAGTCPAGLMTAMATAADKSTAVVLGVTGTGGAGKSSLTDEIIRRFRLDLGDQLNIAVISIDPSRRKSGGALLGDHIRMNAINPWPRDAQPDGSPASDGRRVFMRSLATRAAGSEISAALPGVVAACKAAGFDLVIVETSGIGQGDAAIVPHVDVSLYVMTPDFGAASQLEKIDMLDFADAVAINKFDRKGALDALRDVSKQVQRNREAWTQMPDTMPVFGTQASRFNDDGVTALYQHVRDLLRSKGLPLIEGRLTPVATRYSTAQQPIVPPQRSRYLADISETVRGYKKRVREQARLVREIQQLRASADMWRNDAATGRLANAAAAAAAPDAAHASVLAGGFSALEALAQAREKQLEPWVVEALKQWPETVRNYSGEEHVVRIRDKDIRTQLTHTTLCGNTVRKVSLPTYEDHGELLKFLGLENLPGYFPFTAGVFPFKREGEDPTRMFAGEGDAFRTNKRFHLLSEGMPAKRLSTAFDSVTLYGNNPDPRPDVYGKVGNSGVSIATLDDMKVLYSGFDLCDPATSVSMTINGPAPTILAMYLNTAIDQQVDVFKKDNGRDPTDAEYAGIKARTLKAIRGTVQADILKEDQGQNTCIFSTEFSLKVMGDIQQYFIDKDIRNFYSVSISGYHIAEAGANPISQLAFTLSNGFTFVEAYLARGMHIDDFAPNLSFFFSNGMDPEYTVLGRVARRIWAVAMRERYGANERSQKLKYHIQTSGRSLHAQEIAFNDIRTTLQALIAIYDNCNSLHTNAYDEAITTPTEESVRRAMAIQLIINREWGLAKNENPNQGAFIMDELTELVEEAVLAEFERIAERGGVLGAMETGYQRGKIQDESMHYEMLKHTGELPIIGVNTFRNPNGEPVPTSLELARSTDDEKQSQLKRLGDFHERHASQSAQALKRLQQSVMDNGNVFEELVAAVRCCSLGQITNALFEVGGQYRRSM